MDKSEVKAIVDRNIKPMMALLGVQHWKINVLYEPCTNPNWVASCARNIAYQKATITIDPSRADSEEDVIDSLRHELIHVLLAPFDAYRGIMTSHLTQGDTLDRIEDEAWEVAIENTVLAVERIFDWGLATNNPFAAMVAKPPESVAE